MIQKINELTNEFGYDYHYEPKDLIEIFNLRIQMQLHRPDHEQYIDCSYISICNMFPELKPQLDVIYENYNNSIINEDIKTK